MRYFLLIGCFMVFLAVGVSGCASEPGKTGEEKVQASATELREMLKNTVKDADRLQQMLVLADQAAADLEAGTAELAKLQKEQDRLNADYNASRDEFFQLGERMLSVRKEYRSRFLNARHALAQLATDDEWNKITSR